MTIEASRLSLGYASRTVVSDLSLAFERGGITGLIGPNGSGKSTILHGLGRLLAPTGGALTLDGRAYASWASRAFARNVAVLPQNPSVPEGLSVEALVSYGRHCHRGLFASDSPDDLEAIEEALLFTGLADKRDRPLTELSGGERQRAWIAVALAQQAQFLLLDEPTTYLDIAHQIELMELLSDLKVQRGLTIVAALHDLGQAARYADRLVVLQSGRVIADGPVREIFSRTILAAVFGIEASIEWRGGKPWFHPLGLIDQPKLCRISETLNDGAQAVLKRGGS